VKLNQLGVVLGLAILFSANGNLVMTIAGLLFWGVTVFSINTAQQAQLISHAPALQAVLLPLKGSLLYIGQFLGGVLGSLALVLSSNGLASLPIVGATLLAIGIGIGLSILAEPRAKVGPTVQAFKV
jgi:predicted MFS family arabinose efflux permease